MDMVYNIRHHTYYLRSKVLFIIYAGEIGLSHRKSWFHHLGSEEIVCIVIASVGVGMALAIILPFWWWIIIAAVCLIAYAVNSYFC
jgi:hypothetical protein